MLRQLTDLLLKNRWNAIGAAFLLSLIRVVGGSISIIIVGLVTLRKGAYEGTLVFLASVLPFIINYIAYPVSSETIVLFVATIIVIVINVLTWLFALLLRRYNWSLVIEISVLIGLIAVIALHVMYPELTSWWANQLTAYFHKTTSLLGQLGPSNIDVPESDVTTQMVASMKLYATGFIVSSLIANALLQLLLARWWQATVFNPGGLQVELHEIRMSYLTALIFVAVAVSAYFGYDISVDLLPILVMAFATAGLSLVHGILKTKSKALLWLVLVYLAVIFLFPFGLVVIAIAALLDTFLNFRKLILKS